MRVYLVGFMSVGKTTLGYQLARQLNMRFLDLDQLIANREKQSVQEIFNSQGETYFRQIEKAALHTTFELPQTIVSTGGGTPAHFDNMKQMTKMGLTFYLKLPKKKIIERLELSVKERPLVKNKSPESLDKYIESLIDKRKKFYEMAHFEVDASNKNALHYITRILTGYMH